MNLDRLAVRARLRSHWESVDLGILLARRHWLQMATLWLLPAAGLFLLLALLFPDSPNLALFIVWWFKPLFERLPLLLVSRQLFGEQINTREALKQIRRANGHDWLAWLSWRRLSFTRAFDMPITVLENASGKARSARLAVLHRKAAGTASWLHIVGSHVEMIFSIGLLGLIFLMLPEQLDIDWWAAFSNNENLIGWIANGASLLIFAAVAPFYVCAGFMLYIGRRVELEAWDIEIHFRNLRARLGNNKPAAAANLHAALKAKNGNPKTGPGTALVCALALSLTGALALPEPAVADPVSPAEAQRLIDETLAGDDFHRNETLTRWRLKDFETQEQHIPDWLIVLVEWLEGLGGDSDAETDADLGPLIAGIVELLLWIAAISLVVFILWQLRHHIRRGLRFQPGKRAAEITPPETLFGLDVRRESLPQDVAAEVWRLWQAGCPRDALGLLYRASLSNLISRFECNFQDHHTESECAQLVRAAAEQDPRLQPALVQFFGLVTSTWQQQAYAHRPPASARLEMLCAQWQQVFCDERASRSQEKGVRGKGAAQ